MHFILLDEHIYISHTMSNYRKISDEQASPKGEPGDPRQPSLKVSNESFKMKKPPTQPKPPIIIYTVPPKIIHTEPQNFMSVVQKHTGASSSSSINPQRHARDAEENQGRHHVDQVYGGMGSMENLHGNVSLFQGYEVNPNYSNENNMAGSSASQDGFMVTPGDEWDVFYQLKD